MSNPRRPTWTEPDRRNHHVANRLSISGERLRPIVFPSGLNNSEIYSSAQRRAQFDNPRYGVQNSQPPLELIVRKLYQVSNRYQRSVTTDGKRTPTSGTRPGCSNGFRFAYRDTRLYLGVRIFLVG